MTPMELRAMARAGVTIREQAETFGVSASVVRRLRKRHGIRRVAAWELVPVGALVNGGTAVDIARRVGHDPRSVREAARRRGVVLG